MFLCQTVHYTFPNDLNAIPGTLSQLQPQHRPLPRFPPPLSPLLTAQESLEPGGMRRSQAVLREQRRQSQMFCQQVGIMLYESTIPTLFFNIFFRSLFFIGDFSTEQVAAEVAIFLEQTHKIKM